VRVLLLSLLVLFSASAFAQSCPEGQVFNACDGPQFGGGGCIPGCFDVVAPPVVTDPVAPGELCVPDSCQSVSYAWIGNLVIAVSQLSGGYAVLGWSGPCLAGSHDECPDIMNQAFADLTMNAKRANRAQSVQ